MADSHAEKIAFERQQMQVNGWTRSTARRVIELRERVRTEQAAIRAVQQPLPPPSVKTTVVETKVQPVSHADKGGDGAKPSGGNLGTIEAIVVKDGYPYYATIQGNLGDQITT